MTGGRDIQRFTATQLNASSQRVNMGRAVLISVKYGAAGVLIGLKSSERGSLPFLDDLMNLRVSRGITGSPGDHAAGVAPLMPAAICDLGNHCGVTAQHRHFGALLASVIMAAQQVANGTACTPLAVLQELNVHGDSLPSSSLS